MTPTKEEHKAMAMEIIRQLGGGRFIAMTGAKCFVYDHTLPDANVTFKFSGSRRANYCKIVLDASDTYTVEFYRTHGINLTLTGQHTGVYDTMLQDIFNQETGLYCTMGTMGR